MTHEDRQRIRHAINHRIREQRAHILAMSAGKGRCKECTCPHDEYLPGCKTCLDRERIRAKRGQQEQTA